MTNIGQQITSQKTKTWGTPIPLNKGGVHVIGYYGRVDVTAPLLTPVV